MAELGDILAASQDEAGGLADPCAARVLQLMDGAFAAEGMRIPTFLYRLGAVCQAHVPLRRALRSHPEYQSVLQQLMVSASEQADTYENALCASQMATCQVKLETLCEEYWKGWEQHKMYVLGPKELSGVAVAAGKLTTDFDSFRLALSTTVLDRLVRAVQATETPRAAARFGPLEVSNVSLACAKLNLRRTGLWVCLCAAAAREAGGLTAQHVATVLWAWAKAGARPSAKAVKQIMRGVERTAGTMSPQNLAMCMLGFSGVSQRASEQAWLEVRRAMLGYFQVGGERVSFSAQHVSNILLGLARLAMVDLELLSALVDAILDMPERSWSVQDRCNIAWSCACLVAVLAVRDDDEVPSAGLASKLDYVLLSMLEAAASAPRHSFSSFDTTQIVQAAQALNPDDAAVPHDVRELIRWSQDNVQSRLEKEAASSGHVFNSLRTLLKRLTTGKQPTVSLRCPAVINADMVEAVLEAEGVRVALHRVRTGPQSGALIRGKDGVVCGFHGGLQLQMHSLRTAGYSVVCMEVADGVDLEQYAETLQSDLRLAGLPI